MAVRVPECDGVVVIDAVLELDAVRELLSVCDSVDVLVGDDEAVPETLGLGVIEVLGVGP